MDRFIVERRFNDETLRSDEANVVDRATGDVWYAEVDVDFAYQQASRLNSVCRALPVEV